MTFCNFRMYVGGPDTAILVRGMETCLLSERCEDIAG